MAEMKIDTQRLSTAATDIKNMNGSLNEILGSFSKKVEELQSTWESDAGERTQKAIKNLEPRFEDYRKVLNSYAEYLEKTAESYESTEKTLVNNADNMAAFS